MYKTYKHAMHAVDASVSEIWVSLLESVAVGVIPLVGEIYYYSTSEL